MADGQTNLPYSEEQLKAAARKALAAGDTAAAKRLVDAARAAGSSRAPIRSGVQGATFGLSDEAIAAITNPISAASAATGIGGQGQEYYDRLAAERGKLGAYRRDYPVESAVTELAGAVIPAAIAEYFSGGTATPVVAARTAPLLARVAEAAPYLAKQGAKYGAAYGFGTAEGGLADRALGTVAGAAGGAIAGPIAGAVSYPLVKAAGVVKDAATRFFGQRGGKAVEAELQRLAEGTGLSPDEIAQRVASGEIMAENETLRMTVRNMMAQGGTGETMVREAFNRRPQQTRAAAMEEIQKYLATTGDENVLRGMTMSQEAAKQAERDAYNRIFAGGGAPVTTDVRLALADAFERVPSAAKELSAFTGAETKTDPFFVVRDDGAVVFTRDPTTKEAEIVRRFLRGKQDEAFRTGSPWGEVFKNIEQSVRGPLDVSVPELAATRANWAKVATVREAFETGQQLFNRSADEVEILVDDLLRKGPAGEAQLEALRNGAMDALRAKSRGAGGTSLMATLTNPERKESAILRAILPPDVYDDVAQRAAVAAQSQAARGDIIKGPSTFLAQAAGQRVGAEVNAGEIASALTGNLMSVLSVGTKLAKAAAPQLSDKERVQVLGVLLSEDPEIVRRALTDTAGMVAFKNAVDRLTSRARSGLSGAATSATAQGASNLAAQQVGVQ